MSEETVCTQPWLVSKSRMKIRGRILGRWFLSICFVDEKRRPRQEEVEGEGERKLGDEINARPGPGEDKSRTWYPILSSHRRRPFIPFSHR